MSNGWLSQNCNDSSSKLDFLKLVHRFKEHKISKYHHVIKTSFQIHSNKYHFKNDKFLLVIEFWRNFEIFLSKFIKNIGDSIGESNCIFEI